MTTQDFLSASVGLSPGGGVRYYRVYCQGRGQVLALLTVDPASAPDPALAAPPPDYEAVISAELQQLPGYADTVDTVDTGLPRYADTVDLDTGLPGYEEVKLEMGTAGR